MAVFCAQNHGFQPKKMHLGRTETNKVLNYIPKHNRKKGIRPEGVHLEVQHSYKDIWKYNCKT